MKKIMQVVTQFMSSEGRLFRYALSYSFLLAFMPALIIFVLLYQYGILDIDELLTSMYLFIPEDLISPFIDYLMTVEYASIAAIIIACIASIYVASKMVYSFMAISAKEENHEVYSIVIRVKSFFIFAFLLFTIIAMAIVAKFFGNIISWPFAVGLFFILWLFFRMLSFEKRPRSFGVIGAAFTTIGVSIVGILFLTIVNNFTSYQSLYGPLASLAILLLAMYVISCVLYFGFLLNLAFGKRYDQNVSQDQSFVDFFDDVIDYLKEIFFDFLDRKKIVHLKETEMAEEETLALEEKNEGKD